MKSDDNKSRVDEFLDGFVEIHNGDLRLLKKSMMSTRVIILMPVYIYSITKGFIFLEGSW